MCARPQKTDCNEIQSGTIFAFATEHMHRLLVITTLERVHDILAA
jgi:hypothetical protein